MSVGLNNPQRSNQKGSLLNPAVAAPSQSEIESLHAPIPRFARFVWWTLLYNLAIVAWGVFVRASKSGDGCGSHWPLCDGDSHPMNGPVAKIIEASHRGTTSFAGLLAIVMLIWALRTFPKGHLARKGAIAVMGFTLMEGLIGWALVRFQLVTSNDSGVRAGVMATHVISTFLLLGSMALTGLAGAGIRPIKLKGQSSVGWILAMAGFGLVMIGVSGAISALGHTLMPTDNVLKAAMNPATFWMVRIQPLHPLIAVSVGLYLALANGLVSHLRPDPFVKAAGKWMVGLYIGQLALGTMNIWLKAPIPMQMAHLVVADVNWISLIALATFALGANIEHVEARPAPAEAKLDKPLRGGDVVRAYIALTKPRVISLLLFTTLASAVAAKGEWPGAWLFLAVALGGYMAAGAANAINMVIDRDIDFTMRRTSKRPTVTQSIPSRSALIFAFALAAGSFALLWGAANMLSAVLAFSGLVFYVVVYTMLLKRRTWHNIVIGGAAGAFPPLVGWAAVTNDLPPLALYLFAIIFVWTPVHFWALALLLKDDYAAAGVPMLPVVKGDRFTVIQIAIYGMITAVVTLIPFFMPKVGWIYGGSAVVLNVLLLGYCVRLYKSIDRPRASGLFHYSMLYLAILFLMLAIDRFVVRVLA
ncbi:MAG TPA: heme o synthase [Fimbriimonas sp.]|nr:heme o synthase [Fimbriimonas sp.]